MKLGFEEDQSIVAVKPSGWIRYIHGERGCGIDEIEAFVRLKQRVLK